MSEVPGAAVESMWVKVKAEGGFAHFPLGLSPDMAEAAFGSQVTSRASPGQAKDRCSHRWHLPRTKQPCNQAYVPWGMCQGV